MATLRTVLASFSNRLEKAGGDSPRLSAEVLLAAALAVSRADLLKILLLRPETELTPEVLETADTFLARREKGEPVAYITGTKEFYGRDFLVSPATLIPRPDTETLVDAALAFARDDKAVSPAFLDLGTGSGAIAVTLALELPSWRGLAVDNSAKALAIARRNAHSLGAGNLRFLLEDFSSLAPAQQKYDMVVANPPYIGEDEYRGLSPEIRNFEPKSALVPGVPDATGLECLATILKEGVSLVKSGGKLLMEMGYAQGDALLRLASTYDGIWRDAAITPDLAGLPRVFSASRV